MARREVAEHEVADHEVPYHEVAYYEVMFGYDSDYAYAANVIKNIYLGPGKPGPGDEWNMPRGPLDETAVEADSGAEVTSSSYRGWLGRLVGLLRRQPTD